MHASAGKFQAPVLQGFPNLQASQEVGNHLTFDVVGENLLLYQQFNGWNAVIHMRGWNLSPLSMRLHGTVSIR